MRKRSEPPYLFEDELVRGAFHSFKHTHEFRRISDGTLMVDTFQHVSRLGILGRIADALFLEGYMRALVSERALALKAMAESEINRAVGIAQRDRHTRSKLENRGLSRAPRGLLPTLAGSRRLSAEGR